MFMAKKPKKKNLKQLGKKAEKILTRFKSRFPEIIPNSTIKDWADVLLYIGLGYLSYEKLGKQWPSALFGPIALKLAQSPNIAASVSGVGSLAALGVATAFGEELAEIKDAAVNYASGIADVYKTVAAGEYFTVPFMEQCPTGTLQVNVISPLFRVCYRAPKKE